MFDIIIPVYNCKKYLNESINSLLKQDYLDFEIVLVDDGSTDGSSKICDKFTKLDKRIKVIHIDNSGPSIARNIGLLHCNKPYVLFMDADDIYESDTLSTLKEYIVNKDYELIFFPNFNDCYSNNHLISSSNNKLKKIEIFSNNDLKNNFKRLSKASYINPVWNKCYKRDFLEKLNVQFPKGVFTAEDLVFNLQIYPFINKAIIIDKPLYHYVNRKSGSLCTKFNYYRFSSVIEMYKNSKSIIKGWIPESYNDYLNSILIDLNVCINNLYNFDCELKYREKRKYVKMIMKNKMVNCILCESTFKALSKRSQILYILIQCRQITLLLFIAKLVRFKSRGIYK